MENTRAQAPFFQRFLLRWALLFAVVFPLSFPFERDGILPDPGKYTRYLFEPLAQFTGDQLFQLNHYTAGLMSDTTGFYLNAFNLLVLTLLAALCWTFFSKNRDNVHRLVFVLQTWIRYYLALQMLWYGFDKLFKVQFYLPEPNTLFTTVGNTQRDLLYWSVMGTSYTYTFFSGLIEVVAAVLLLFHRTALLGILFTAGIMTNVLMINIGFDISVKLYSGFLLLLGLIFITVHAKNLFRFFILQLPAAPVSWRPSFSPVTFYRIAKVLTVLLMLTDVLLPFVRAGNYNDDLYPRPPLHGAYRVNSFIWNGQPLEPDLRDRHRWKRFFVHRRGYFIVQYMNDEMQDLELQCDTAGRQLFLKDYDSSRYVWHYIKKDRLLELEGIIGHDTLKVKAEKLRLESLPLLQNEFGWTINE
jgi:hypothetical protein